MSVGAQYSICYPSPSFLPRAAEPKPCRSCRIISATAQGGESRSRRRVWRRRKLTKEDDKVRYKMERIPFLEEQVRKIRQNGKIISMDIEKLLLSEENRFAFVNEVAAEATSYIEKNRDEYGSKKAILHVLSNRMNEAGFYRTEAYMEPDPFKPGPNYLKEGFD
ncbi:protein PLASTID TRANSCRIPTIONALLY ACTIVE 7 isoform X2 [Ananas comosus]|uniref:Protein PLASTID TRANSCRIPTIONALLY ACTIVE 7 isoform X2 n=1 Tax=Ananas comosus TaxID=4615 RepID=A0A6P5FU24_ANACO|nr:protein PLASTID TRANSCRIPTIONALLY ACTIVE 7 isoform X2 [Ananas comosus]